MLRSGGEFLAVLDKFLGYMYFLLVVSPKLASSALFWCWGRSCYWASIILYFSSYSNVYSLTKIQGPDPPLEQHRTIGVGYIGFLRIGEASGVGLLGRVGSYFLYRAILVRGARHSLVGPRSMVFFRHNVY